MYRLLKPFKNRKAGMDVEDKAISLSFSTGVAAVIIILFAGWFVMQSSGNKNIFNAIGESLEQRNDSIENK